MYYNPKGSTLETALQELIKSYNEIGRKCYEHCDKYFNFAKIIRKFLEAVENTQLTLGDLEETKITQHSFWAKKIERIRGKLI